MAKPGADVLTATRWSVPTGSVGREPVAAPEDFSVKDFTHPPIE